MYVEARRKGIGKCESGGRDESEEATVTSKKELTRVKDRVGD